jgi:hypothetical protein
MRGIARIAAACAVGALWSVAAQAQVRLRSGNSTVVAPAGAQVIRMPATQLRSQSGSHAAPLVTSGTSAETLVSGSYPVPGLGFDYTHHAAVNRNLATRALIDPVTQRRLEQELRLRRSAAPVSVAFPAIINNIQIVVVPPPPVVILPAEEEPQEEAPRQRRRRAAYDDEGEPPGRDRPGRASRPQQEESVAPPAAPREVGELVLIRRDGALVFAIAYMVRGDRVVYVTREGHRQALYLNQLDVDATRDMNESLGTSLKL